MFRRVGLDLPQPTLPPSASFPSGDHETLSHRANICVQMEPRLGQLPPSGGMAPRGGRGRRSQAHPQRSSIWVSNPSSRPSRAATLIADPVSHAQLGVIRGAPYTSRFAFQISLMCSVSQASCSARSEGGRSASHRSPSARRRAARRRRRPGYGPLRRDDPVGDHRVSVSFAKKAAARLSRSRSCFSRAFSRRSRRSSSRSSLRSPSSRSRPSSSVCLTHLRSDCWERRGSRRRRGPSGPRGPSRRPPGGTHRGRQVWFSA